MFAYERKKLRCYPSKGGLHSISGEYLIDRNFSVLPHDPFLDMTFPRPLGEKYYIIKMSSLATFRSSEGGLWVRLDFGEWPNEARLHTGEKSPES